MVTSTIVVAIIIGLTEVIKRAVGLRKKYLPLVAVVLGLIYALTSNGLDITSVWQGIMFGLISVGLFSSAKNTIK